MSGMVYTSDNIRAALPGDAHAIASVHVESWKTTYSGLVSDTYLSDLSIEVRERFWKETLSAQEWVPITLVGCDSQARVVGFISGGPERTGRLGHDGEIYAIYLLQSTQRQRLGTLLFEALARELKTRSFASLAVWVLAGNPFRTFYEALGGQVIAEQVVEIGGQSFLEVAYGWDHLG